MDDQVAAGAHIARTYIETGHYVRAREVLSGLLSREPTNLDLLRLDAYAEYQLGNYPRAERSALAALAIEPADEWAMRLHALTLDGLGRQDEAL